MARTCLTSTLALVLVLAANPAFSQFLDACIAPDNGTGTVTMPPEGCRYRQTQSVFILADGLPAGTIVEMTLVDWVTFCRSPAGTGPCSVVNGGLLGGQVETFDATMVLKLRGTGDLNGFERTAILDATAQTSSAPRTPGDPVQAFDTTFDSLVASLAPGDPDFAQLQILAGADEGQPLTFGHTNLKDLGDGTFIVDRFAQLNYQVTFTGAPGGALEGLSGTTSSVSRIESRSVRPQDRCEAPDDGGGTVALPPSTCGYRSDNDLLIVNSLPGGSTILLEPLLGDFVCNNRGGDDCGQPGGNLGGRRESYDATLRLYLQGTGSLSTFRRALRVPVSVVTDSAPRTSGWQPWG